MKADSALIRSLIHGAVEIQEENGMIQMFRLTSAERDVYSKNAAYTLRTFAASGMRLEFRTDARSVVLSGTASPASSRKFYYFDVSVNGVLCHHTGFESCEEHPEFRFEFELGSGSKEVCIYFPCLTRIGLTALDFSGESVIEPLVKKRLLLCYGDSITQGYDARYPSLSYPNQLADALHSEMFNKAIGGDWFNFPLAAAGARIRPDLITVAYGTNDWSHSTSRDVFMNNCSAFFRNLTERYPDVPVFALQPIWRTQCETRVTDVGSFSEMYEMIRTITAEYPQIRLVNGLALVPHLESCFSPDVLHPNDFGFQFMGRNLLHQIKAAGIGF